MGSHPGAVLELPALELEEAEPPSRQILNRKALVLRLLPWHGGLAKANPPLRSGRDAGTYYYGSFFFLLLLIFILILILIFTITIVIIIILL